MARVNFFGKNTTKLAYDSAFAEAKEWGLTYPEELPTTVARIFDVKPDAIRQSLFRERRRKKQRGILRPDTAPGRGGHNKVLSATQEEAILRFCKEQWEIGLGATYSMVKAAIKHLLAVRLQLI